MGKSRFVVVSGYYPPVVGGTSTVMRNLLSAFDPEDFAVVSETPGSFDGAHDVPIPPGVRVRQAGVPAFVTRRIPYGNRIKRWLRYGLIPQIAGLIDRSVREIGASMILSVYPSWPFFIAAWLAHRRTGLPLVTYYMDVSPEASQVAWPDRAAIRWFELKILRSARERLVLSEAIQEDFKTRFGLSSVVIPHSIDLAECAPPDPWPKPDGKRLIVHTGVIEGLQREGILRLASILQAHPELNARLVLATPTSREDILHSGFDLPCVEIHKLSNAQVRSLQHSADVLVAVLPFHGEIAAYQLTAFPTKVVEYMAASVPILAHAPGGSFFARHVRAHGYAELVDEPDPDLLYRKLLQILEDAQMRQRLLERARDTVHAVFALDKVAARFASAAGL